MEVVSSAFIHKRATVLGLFAICQCFSFGLFIAHIVAAGNTDLDGEKFRSVWSGTLFLSTGVVSSFIIICAPTQLPWGAIIASTFFLNQLALMHAASYGDVRPKPLHSHGSFVAIAYLSGFYFSLSLPLVVMLWLWRDTFVFGDAESRIMESESVSILSRSFVEGPVGPYDELL